MSILMVMCYSTPTLGSESNQDLTIKVNIEQYSPLKKELLNLANNISQNAKQNNTSKKIIYWRNKTKKHFKKLLRAQGYFDHDVTTTVNTEKNVIIVNITTSPPYTISVIDIRHTNTSNTKIPLPKHDILLVKVGQAAVAQNIIDAQKTISQYIENHYCLFDISVSHKAYINYHDKTVRILLLVDVGQVSAIGDINITGLKTVNASYVRKLLPLKTKQCFRNTDIIKSEQILRKTGLFSTVHTKTKRHKDAISSDQNAEQLVPVTFDLSERKFRTLKFGAGYTVDLGPTITPGWKHSNLFGNGEEIRANIRANKREQMLEMNYTEPFFKQKNQTLTIDTKIENNQSKAFLSKELASSIGLRKKLTDQWTGGASIGWSRSYVKDHAYRQNRNFSIISTPLFMIRDTRDDTLNPHNGSEVSMYITPYINIHSTHDMKLPFFKTTISGATYFAFSKNLESVIAIKGSTGSILGNKLCNIPSTERFYMGGNNSIRGYAHQLAGLLNDKNLPIGGRSFTLTNIELRLQITKEIGIVGFFDSGFAYKSTIPNYKKKLLHGAGIGIRYHTAFGPLRLDIGFPITRRKSIDKSLQLYFGIGQSF